MLRRARRLVVALPNGTRSDWLKNVVASGSARIVTEGHTYLVEQPEVIPLDAARSHFPAKEQRSLRMFGVDQCLRVRRVDEEQAPTDREADVTPAARYVAGNALVVAGDFSAGA